MKVPQLGELVKDKLVIFSFYRDETLWYQVEGTEFMFPVSGEDLRGATFLAKSKAVFFMRWIRKHLEYLQESLKQEGIEVS